MSIKSFTRLVGAAVVAAVLSVGIIGCSDDDDGGSRDSNLVGVWVFAECYDDYSGECEGMMFEASGGVVYVEFYSGVWFGIRESGVTWSTSGNKLFIYYEGYLEEEFTYSVSGNTLTFSGHHEWQEGTGVFIRQNVSITKIYNNWEEVNCEVYGYCDGYYKRRDASPRPNLFSSGRFGSRLERPLESQSSR